MRAAPLTAEPLAPAPRPGPRERKDDRFERALAEHDQADRADAPPRPRPAARRDRRAPGAEHDPATPTPTAAPAAEAVPPRTLQVELALTRWLAQLGGIAAAADATGGPGGPGAPAPQAGDAATAGHHAIHAGDTPRAADDATAAALTDAPTEAPAGDPSTGEPPPTATAATPADQLLAAISAEKARDGRPAPHAEAAPAAEPTAPAPPLVAATLEAAPREHARAAASDAPPAAPDVREPTAAGLDAPRAAPVERARLVLDHEGERVVVSVAVRHGAVSVAVDAGGSTLAAAVSASLDQLDAALHGHGMHLADLSSHRDPRDTSDTPPRPAPRRPDGVAGPDDDLPLTLDPRLRALA